jgi:hypothetical protein
MAQLSLLQRPQRTLFLAALATACGLVLAAVGLFRPAPRLLLAVPPGYAALVNQKGILLNDFRAQVELEATKTYAETTPAERSRTLREMINEELLVQRAVVLDLPETANEVRANMAVGVNSQVAAPVLAYRPTLTPAHPAPVRGPPRAALPHAGTRRGIARPQSRSRFAHKMGQGVAVFPF